MNSTSSPVSTENSTIIYFESLKDRALSLIKEEAIDEKEIIACSKDLLLIPNLDEDIVPLSSHLFDINSFEISHKEKVNPVFIRNLINIVQVLNFIWIASKNKVDIFHKTLLSLGIVFSFLFRNEKDEKEGVDYALLAPIPNIIYDFIAKKGEKSFKIPNQFKFDEELFKTDKSETQIGYVYQETSISQILSNLYSQSQEITICPRIIYYLEYNSSKELFNKNIFNSPSNFLELVHNEKEYNGYNEIDLSFTLSETVKIKENYIFNIVKEKNDDFISRFYSEKESKYITFEKDSNIFIELKSNIKNEKIEDILFKLKNMAQRFSCGYKNIAYSFLDKKFSKNNISYFLIYDDNRIELFKKVTHDTKIEKEIEICYNSFNAPISAIVSLQNQIREIKKEVSSQNDKIIILQEQNKINDLKLSIMNIKTLNVKEKSIQAIVKKFLEDKSLSHFDTFKIYNKLFIESSIKLEKINPLDEIITLNNKIIGSKEIDAVNYLKLINLLENKIKNKTFAECYYLAYRNALTGKLYVESDGKKCDFPECNEEIVEVLKNFLKFIYLLDKDPLLLNSFFAAILYYAIAISNNDKNYTFLYYTKFNSSNIRDCVIYLIQSINPTYI